MIFILCTGRFYAIRKNGCIDSKAYYDNETINNIYLKWNFSRFLPSFYAMYVLPVFEETGSDSKCFGLRSFSKISRM